MPKNGYMHFANEVRKEVMDSVIKKIGKKSIPEVSKNISARWHKLTPKEKEPYNLKADEERKEYYKAKGKEMPLSKHIDPKDIEALLTKTEELTQRIAKVESMPFLGYETINAFAEEHNMKFEEALKEILTMLK